MNKGTVIRKKALDELAYKIEKIESPLRYFREQNNKKYVSGDGDIFADVMIIGEAPGAKEAEQGKPFVGASGKITDELFLSIGKSRGDFYITNIVKDRPEGNRNPTREEIEAYAPILDSEIEIIKPKIIVTLGNFSTQYVLTRYGAQEKADKITKIHGQFFQVAMPYGEVSVFPLFHPSYTIYNRSAREVLFSDFAKLKNRA